MLTRQESGPAAAENEATAFAAKAKDLGALRDAVVDAASVGAGLWFSYLFVFFYFAIAAGAVTHRDLLLESAVNLPFLNVQLPLRAFFILGPLVFLIVHAYVLLHFVLLAGKIGAFHLELQTQITGDDTRARLRRQLPSNIFVQSLAGPREVRTGIIGFLLRRILDISLVIGPIALLVLFQLQFLPYHHEGITSWQRLAVVIDLVLLWILWPSIARGETVWLGWKDFRRFKVLASLIASTLPILLTVTIATFPGEWLEEKLPPLRLVPTTWGLWALPSVEAIQGEGPRWATLHELLVAGQVNYVTGRPQSLWSNVLVSPNFEAGDRARFDAEGKVAISAGAIALRGRSLEGAVLTFAHLRNADFTGASLGGARFFGADLREANFGFDWIRGGSPGFLPFIYNADIGCGRGIRCAQLQGADFSLAHLQGASFARAQLAGAIFQGAQLQGADLGQAVLPGAMLDHAYLQAASLNLAQLQGANLNVAQLQGADLEGAQLQGAWLHGAQLQGANLDHAQLQGVDLTQPQLEGASLFGNYVWRTDPPSNAGGAFVDAPKPGPIYSGLDCGVRECDWSARSYAVLKSLIENSISPVELPFLVLQRISVLESPPSAADEGWAKAWMDLANESVRSTRSYYNNLTKTLKEIGCAADGAPYVIRGLISPIPGNGVRLDSRFAIPSQEAEVAASFLDEANCLGARGLSEENKAKLQAIRDRGLPKSH
jgi:uncharacterized protein YjbI with pentapeptide repeats